MVTELHVHNGASQCESLTTVVVSNNMQNLGS